MIQRVRAGFVFLSVFLSILLTSGPSLSNETILVTGHPNYPPFSWVEDGELVGASLDLVNLIFSEKKITATAVMFGPWGRLQKAAENNTFDLVLGVLKTTERQHYLHFIDEYYTTDPIAIFVHQDENAINSISALQPRMGAANRGESFGVRFDAFAQRSLNLTRVTDINQAFLMLNKKRIDYVVHGYYPSLVSMQSLSLQNIRQADFIVANPKAFQAFTHDSSFKALAPWFAERVKYYRDNGTVEELINQNLAKWKMTH